MESVTRDRAEALALECLTWLVGNEELFAVFLGSTGVDAADLRGSVQDTDFLASVLDFLLMDDAWVMAFCADAGLPNEAPMRARAALPGGAQVHWT